MKKGILLCCHGSRSSVGTKDTLKLLKLFKKKYRSYTVKIGYLEINKITIKKQLDFFFKKKFDKLIIVPVMIFSGNHSSKDIPKVINSVRNKYSKIPELLLTKPLVNSKIFVSKIEKKLKSKIKTFKKQDIALILVASNTINLQAKREMNYLLKKLAKRNNIIFYKKILVGLNGNESKNKLLKIKKNKKYIFLLPLFLFRGSLFFILESIVKKLNNELKINKFKMLPIIKSYNHIFLSISKQLDNT